MADRHRHGAPRVDTAPAAAHVYIYDPAGNVTIDFPRLGVAFAGVANNVHLTSWPGQFHGLVANDLPGNDVAVGTRRTTGSPRC